MFTFRATAVPILLVALLSSTARAGGSCHDVILLYDHRADHWDVQGLDKDRLELDFKGTPTLYLPKACTVTLRVVNTNPLLFGLGDFEVKEENISGLEKLQELAAAIGAAIQGHAVAAESIGGEVHAAAVQNKTNRDALLVESAQLACLLRELLAERFAAIALAQSLANESSNSQWDPAPADCKRSDETANTQPISLPTYLEAFGRLESAFLETKKDALGCSASLSSLVSALTQNLANEDGVTGLETKFLESIAKPNSESCHSAIALFVTTSATSGLSAVARYKKAMAESTPSDKTVPLETLRREIAKLRGEHLGTTLACQSLSAGEQAAFTAATELLSKRDDVLDPLFTVADVDRRLGVKRDSADPPPVDARKAPPLEWTPKPQKHRWDKTHSYTFKLKKNSPVAAKVQSPLHSEVTRSFVLAPQTGRLLGFGVGLTFTDLVAPSWGLVTDPANSSQKIVTRTSEKSRSGELAVLGVYRFLQHARPKTRTSTVKPLLEFGAGVDTGNAALYLGLGVEIAKYVRVGYGRTWQRVDALKGLEEGSIVDTSTTTVATKSDTVTDWYASFTLSIDPLVFFKSD